MRCNAYCACGVRAWCRGCSTWRTRLLTSALLACSTHPSPSNFTSTLPTRYRSLHFLFPRCNRNCAQHQRPNRPTSPQTSNLQLVRNLHRTHRNVPHSPHLTITLTTTPVLLTPLLHPTMPPSSPRLYAKARILGYTRAKRNQKPTSSLVQIEGVADRKEAEFYFGKVSWEGGSEAPLVWCCPWWCD